MLILHAQDMLDKVITFEELMKRRIERNVSWSNPDGTKETLKLIEIAIPVDETMKQRITAFTKDNYGINSPWLQPKMIVFHSMDLNDLKSSLEKSSLLNDRIPDSWGKLSKAGTLPNGAHFIIDKEGTVYCLTPPLSADEKSVDYTSPRHQWYIKRHQDGNPFAIGIENVTTANGDFTDLTTEQIEANARLARWLIQFEENKIKYLTSHHQFNDEKKLNHFHHQLGLNYKNKPYRTVGRQDIGEPMLNEIIQKVNSFGYDLISNK